MAAEDKDLNRDPMGDDHSSHPVGTGIGAAGGAVAGAAAGAMGGPVGMAVGGVVGAIVGGLAGRAAAQAVDPAAEDNHWRDNYQNEPYYRQGRSYDDYSPAYRLGMSGRAQHEGDWDSAEPRLASEWESTRGSSRLDWDEARPATRAAWDRIDSGSASLRASEGSSSMGSSTVGTSSLGSGSATGSMGSTSMSGSQSMDTGSMSQGTYDGNRQSMGGTGTSGAAAAVGAMQGSGDNSGDRDDTIDVLQDLAECSLDGAYGFRECAEQAQSADLKSLFSQRAQDCERAAQELNQQIRSMGGTVEEHGSASAALHRGWVSVKTALSTMDDKAVLEECERGEDNAMARYRKALQKPMPAECKLMVERQMQGVQRNHDQVKMLRNQYRGQQG